MKTSLNLAPRRRIETKSDDDQPFAKLQKAVEVHAEVVKDRLGKTDGTLAEVKARMADLEQKLDRQGVPTAPVSNTWGRQVISQEGFKSIGSNWRGRQRFEVKSTATITSASGGSAGDAGALAPADRQEGAILLPQRKLRMRDVFAPGNTERNAVEWPRQTGRSNNAATVAEGNLKPQSDMTFDLRQWPVRTIAHWMLASKQILDDAPALQSMIDSDLRYGLKFVEDNQLLNGGGTGSDLVGVQLNATPFAAPIALQSAGNLTKIDILLLAIAQVQQADYEPDFIAMNPLDWADIQSIKTEDGKYVGGGPFSAQAAILWRLPIVETKAQAMDSFLVGAGKMGAQIFDRQEATVEISTEDSDNFRKNLVTLLGEERLAFVIKHPDAFVKGTFTDALASS